MKSPAQAFLSDPADDFEFFRDELEAFVETSKRQRPAAWARVEQLQRACRSESPAQAGPFERLARTPGEQTAA